MKRIALLSLLVPFSATAAATQAEPSTSPAQELAGFEALVGRWTGSGTVRDKADAEALAWTAESSIERILGGHCIREDLSVDFGEAIPGRLEMSAIYGFDAERGRLVSYAVSNFESGVSVADVYWQGAGVLVSFTTTKDAAGTPTMERRIVRVTEAGWTLRIEYSVGAEPTFTHAEGRFTRAEADATAHVRDASASFVPAPSEMERLGALVGVWRVEGEMTMVPGAEPMQFMGTDTYTVDFGGQILASHVVGDEGPMGIYEGIGLAGWQPDDSCYRFAWADNMGMIMMSEARWADDRRLVFTHSRAMMGQPSVERAILEFGEHGITAFSSDRMLAVHAAERAFEATYIRAN